MDAIHYTVVGLGGFVLICIVGQAVTKYRLHRAGDLSLEEPTMTVIDGFVLTAICLIFADVSPFSLLAAFLTAYATILVALLHLIDKGTLWLVTRRQTTDGDRP